MKTKPVLLVSACLLGVQTRYNGGHHLSNAVVALAQAATLIPVCPEQLGGLPTPRPAAEIRGGDGKAVLQGAARVVTAAGEDRTAIFLQGGRETLHIARMTGAVAALLKARSPSCGSGEIYDGSFSGRRVAGDGVTAGMLKALGLAVFSEEHLAALREWLSAGDG
jgi:uncharacterized protein YbbK (DUF523 family)